MRDLTGQEAMTIHRALAYSPVEGGFQRDEPERAHYDREPAQAKGQAPVGQ